MLNNGISYLYGLLALMGVYSVPWVLTYSIGTPKCHLSVEEVVSRACLKAEVYRHCGVHGLIVENMHDTPYLNGGLGPEVTACMTRVTSEVRRVVPGLALGVQILSGEWVYPNNH